MEIFQIKNQNWNMPSHLPLPYFSMIILTHKKELCEVGLFSTHIAPVLRFTLFQLFPIAGNDVLVPIEGLFAIAFERARAIIIAVYIDETVALGQFCR